MGNHMKTNSLSFRVYVTPEEKQQIQAAAHDCRMSMSAYCRNLALGDKPTNKLDHEHIDKILKVAADLSRLGNLMKMLLTNDERLNDMGRDMATTTIDNVLVDIRFSVAGMRELVDHLHGLHIGDIGEDEDEQAE